MDASGGNALFLRHLVDGAIEAGTLRESKGVWQLRGRTAITSEPASLLEGRIDRLDDEVLAVLEYLSLCEPASLDVLVELTGESAVERAEALDLVGIARQGSVLGVRYTHPLFGRSSAAGSARSRPVGCAASSSRSCRRKAPIRPPTASSSRIWDSTAT